MAGLHDQRGPLTGPWLSEFICCALDLGSAHDLGSKWSRTVDWALPVIKDADWAHCPVEAAGWTTKLGWARLLAIFCHWKRLLLWPSTHVELMAGFLRETGPQVALPSWTGVFWGLSHSVKVPGKVRPQCGAIIKIIHTGHCEPLHLSLFPFSPTWSICANSHAVPYEAWEKWASQQCPEMLWKLYVYLTLSFPPDKLWAKGIFLDVMLCWEEYCGQSDKVKLFILSLLRWFLLFFMLHWNAEISLLGSRILKKAFSSMNN